MNLDGNQPITNLLKDKNGYVHADSHNIFNRRKNYFCQWVNVHGVRKVRQTKIHTTEPLVSEPNPFQD
jgi:hypothetical protein